MQKLTYPYSPIRIAATPGQSQRIAYRPQLVATLSTFQGRSVRFISILDTGADACVFPQHAAQWLGLDILKLRRAITSGVGSQKNVTFYETLRIDLGHGISFEAEVGFTQGLNALGIGLLGQTGFFENYNVEFRRADKAFIIEVPEAS